MFHYEFSAVPVVVQVSGPVRAMTPLFAKLKPAPAPGTVPESNQYYVGELLAVLVMFGLALFAVCRSSRRG